jgi:NhaA family Na+:H+ antiporter
VFAATGGAIVPAIIYQMFNYDTDAANGWGIPMATDIAFALAFLSLLGNKVPASLKIFLAALAIMDDLIAILVIAVFYSSGLRVDYLLYSSAVLLIMIVLNRLNFTSLIVYLIPGLVLWYCIHHSGIHAAIAGFITALTIPVKKQGIESPLHKLELALMKPVNLAIMPLFALANTNIRLDPDIADTLLNKPSMGIIIGLLFGKPIGITLASCLVIKSKMGTLPSHANWKHLIGIGLLAGIGFTMSIFITLLSFHLPGMQSQSKFAVLVASMLSATAGYCVLLLAQKRNKTIT